MAKRAYNSARRGKLAYQGLTFILAVFLIVAAVYAVLSFKDDQSARGILGVITSVGSLATAGFLGALAKDAKEDEDAMWQRVTASCGGGGAAPGPGDGAAAVVGGQPVAR
jgi:hypothetical protein